MELDEQLPLPKVARMFNVSTDTIRKWIKEEGFPNGFWIGGKRFFRAVDVRVWQEKQQQNQSPPPARGKEK